MTLQLLAIALAAVCVVVGIVLSVLVWRAERRMAAIEQQISDELAALATTARRGGQPTADLTHVGRQRNWRNN